MRLERLQDPTATIQEEPPQERMRRCVPHAQQQHVAMASNREASNTSLAAGLVVAGLVVTAHNTRVIEDERLVKLKVPLIC